MKTRPNALDWTFRSAACAAIISGAGPSSTISTASHAMLAILTSALRALLMVSIALMRVIFWESTAMTSRDTHITHECYHPD
jgi:hypothetical protein